MSTDLEVLERIVDLCGQSTAAEAACASLWGELAAYCREHDCLCGEAMVSLGITAEAIDTAEGLCAKLEVEITMTTARLSEDALQHLCAGQVVPVEEYEVLHCLK